MFPGPGDQKDLGHYLAIGQVGMEMAAPIALGWLVDSYFGASHWGVIAGAVIGFVGGLVHLVRMTSPKRPPPGGRTSAGDDGSRGKTP
jgi:F0F1-type ATP synthase assembly protein I